MTVAAVIERENLFLLVEEQIAGRRVFNQPAGHLEADESLLDAVHREVMEETAHPFEAESLTGIYQYPVPDSQRCYLRFCFAGRVSGALPDRPLDEEIVATHWLSLEQIRKLEEQLRSPMVLRCIEDYLHGARLPLNTLHYLSP